MSGATNDHPNNPGHSNASPNLPRVLAVLDLLTEDELIELNHRIVKRLRLMREIHAHDNMMNFRIGQRVKFPSTSGQMVHGVIARHNRKSVTIIVDAGGQWRVSPGLVQPA